jgi:acyl-CoA thioester hydrolase
MTSHETRFRVRYAETDQMGIVYYANYFIWMELGRAEYCRAAGVRYKDMEADDGILLAVADAHCRYLAPARYDEEIAVITSIGMANRRMLEFRYEIRDPAADRALAHGETRHVFLNREMKPVSLPEKYFGAFGIAPRTSNSGGAYNS